MTKEPSAKKDVPLPEIDLTDADIFEAMKLIPGYLDITPGDFKEVYVLAYRQAVERLSKTVTARQIMTRDVVAVVVETPLAEVAEAMGQRGVAGVPVLDEEGRVVGVISEKDILSRLGVAGPKNFMNLVATCLKAKGCLAMPLTEQKAGDIMNAPPVTVGAEATVQDIAEVLARRHINRVVVTDGDGRLLGLVSRGDIVKAAGREGQL